MKNEYYCGSCAHKGHTMNEYLDDYDFNFIVNEMYEELKDNGYGADDMSEVDEDVFDMIEECIRDIVENKACTDFGWKYGSWTAAAVRSIVEDIIEEVRKKL